MVRGGGLQGSSVEEVRKDGRSLECGLLVNARRAIIDAGNGEDFGAGARTRAQQYQTEMAAYIK